MQSMKNSILLLVLLFCHALCYAKEPTSNLDFYKNSAAERPSFYPFNFAARGKPALATQAENSHFSPWVSPSGCVRPQAAEFKLQTLLHYYNSNDYTHDQDIVAQNAIAYLQKRVAENQHAFSPKKFAIVFDIDETVLSNFKFLRDADFAKPSITINNSLILAQDPPITATFKLYQQAIANKIAVFFITGRSEKFKTATVKNLQQAGFSRWAGVICKPIDYHANSAAYYKTAARKKITQQGYDIIINIGDQYSDLVGGYADKTFKMPNPYYFIP